MTNQGSTSAARKPKSTARKPKPAASKPEPTASDATASDATASKPEPTAPNSTAPNSTSGPGPSQRDALSPAAVTAWVLLGLTIVGLAAHARHYWPFLSDDGLISLRYSQRLLEGEGLTWTNGERVEGYTDLLWVLLCALLGATGMNLVVAARLLDFIGAAAALYFVSLDPERLEPRASRVFGSAMFAASPPLAVWAIGGLEHGFMVGITACAMVFLYRAWAADQPRQRDLWVAGGCLAALALLRADGAMLVGAIGLGAIVGRIRPGHLFLPSLRELFSLKTLKLLLPIGATPVTALLLQLAFRLAYYGEWVPNTALAKVSFNSHRLELGIEHVKTGSTALIVFGVAAMLGAWLAAGRTKPGRVAVPFTLVVVWTAYLASVGGDIFPGWRQLLLAIPGLAFLVAEGAQQLESSFKRAPAWGSVAAGFLLLVSFSMQRVDSENKRAKGELWEWEGYSMGPVLKRAFEHQEPLLAVDAAGALPFWSELPALDMLGLNDKYLVRHPPEHFGRGAIGHELGDGQYVWRREPDIIAFNNACGSPKPVMYGGKQLIRLPGFRQRYQGVRIKGTRKIPPKGRVPVCQPYIRREGGKLGIQRFDDRVVIPGYLFSSYENGVVAELDRDGTLAVMVHRDAVASVGRLNLGAGTWEVKTVPEAPELTTGLRCGAQSATRVSNAQATTFEVQGNATLFIGSQVAPTNAIPLQSVELRRVQGKATHRCPRANGWVTASLDDLSHRKTAGMRWDLASNVLFTKPGLRVTLGQVRHARHIELSVDNNDEYELRFQRDDQTLGTARIRPTRQSGLAVHRISVPRALQADGIDQLELVPLSGDHRFSVGHLILTDRPR